MTHPSPTATLTLLLTLKGIRSPLVALGSLFWDPFVPMPRKKKLPPNVRRHGSGYRAVITVDGQRYRSPVFDSVDEAVQWLVVFRSGQSQPRDQQLTLTLGDGMQLIRDDLEATGSRQATHRYYENHGRIVVKAFGGESRLLHEITTAQLQDYIKKRRKAGAAPQTIVGKELFILKRMMRLARFNGHLLPVDPFATLRAPKSRSSRFDVLTKAQIAEIVTKMREWPVGNGRFHADLVELMFATGMRRAELERLCVDDINIEAGRIFLDGKTNNRYQPFGKSLEPVLRRLIASAQPDGRIVTSFRMVESMFANWKKRLRLQAFSPHVIRHSYATEMASHVGPYELMALMRHSSLTQTSRYYHGRGAAVRGALDSLELRPPEQEHPE